MNILLSSAGRRSYLIKYFRDALNGNGFVYASNSEYSAALQQADDYVITPLINDAGYIEFLLEFCRENDISVIIPLFDIDLPVLSKAKEKFRSFGIKIIVSDYKVTQICTDKWKTKDFLDKVNLSCPKTYLSINEAKKDIRESHLNFPLILKPRWGMGSIGIYVAYSVEELDVLYEKVVKDIFNSYLVYESSSDRSHCVIIQDKLDGKEYGLDVVNNLKGEYITTFVKEKIAMRSGETDMAITVNNPMLENVGRDISHYLKHIGNLDVDCIVNNNDVYILDMNCRLGGGYPFSHLAGANLPAAILEWVDGKEADEKFLNIEYGIKGVKDILPIELKSKHGK